jgi:hypothetical protein
MDDPQEIQEREISRGVIHLNYFHLQVGPTPQWQTSKESRLNPKNLPSEQTLRTKAVQSLYNENRVNAKLVFWYNQSWEISNVILLPRLVRCQSCEQPPDHAMIYANCWQVINFWPSHPHEHELEVNLTRLIRCQSWEQPSDQVSICINYWQVINCWSNQTLINVNTSLINVWLGWFLQERDIGQRRWATIEIWD